MANDRALVIKVSILRVSARRHEAEAEASRSSKRYKPSSNFDPSLTADLVSSSAAIYCHLLHLMPIYRSMRYDEEAERAQANVGRKLSSYSGTHRSIWDYYNEMASGVDASRETEWGGLAETILLFAGLFAAVLTAFLLFTITKLQADNNDISKDILLHISLQLSNSSAPAFVEPQFFVDSHWAVINALLFASLALVLVDAYLAVLTRGWLREFDQGWKSSSVPEERARKREMRLQGLNRWKLHWVVSLLPQLIQASLVLFFISLVLILINLYHPIAYPTLCIFAAGSCFYTSTTLISTFDTNSPFTSLDSKVLRALIPWARRCLFTFIRWSCRCPYIRWRRQRRFRPGRRGPDDELGGEEIYLAICNRLRDATSEAVENVPVFIEIFDQRVYTSGLHARSLSDWRQVLPLVQTYLSNESPCQDHILRSVARLFLWFNQGGTHTGRQAVIQALKHDTGYYSIEWLYIHLLHQPESDWSLACQVVPYLEADGRTIIELRWILDHFVFRVLTKNQEFTDERETPSIAVHCVTFLCGIAVCLIRNRIMNDDHGLFDSLLHTTRFIVSQPDGVGNFHARLFKHRGQWQLIRDLHTLSCTSAAGRSHHFRLLIMLLLVRVNSAVIHLDIYDSITYDLFTDPERDLPRLMDILWEIWKSYDAERLVYERHFLDGRALDGHSSLRHLLIGVAARLLQRDASFVHKTPPVAQQNVQDLLDAYDSYTSESIHLVTPNGLQFIEAILLFVSSHPSATPNPDNLDDEDRKWEPQTVKLSNPWLVMHVHNILRRDWRVQAGSAMREAVWGRLDPLGRPDWLDKWLKWLDRLGHLLYRLKQLERLKDIQPTTLLVRLHRLAPQLERIDLRLKSLKRLKWIDQISPLDPLFEQVDCLDRFNHSLKQLKQLDPYLKQLSWLDQFDELDHITQFGDLHRENRDQLDQQLDQRLEQQLDRLDEQLALLAGLGHSVEHLDPDWQLHQSEEQRSTMLEMIAKSRLNLYNTKVLLRPDLVPLALFLSPRNTDMFSDSRRLILELLGSTPSVLPLLPPGTAEAKVVDARALCSDFFDSKAIGDLTKWRLLALVVLQEWETILTEWKDLLAAEVLKVDWVDDQRVDWMARVTPILAGKFNLSEFMVGESPNSDPDVDSDPGHSDSTYGSLAPMHLRMVAIIVEHLGTDKLTNQTVSELEKFLEQHSHILCNPEELGRIRTVISQAKARSSQSGSPLAQLDPGIITAGPSHSPE